MRATCLRVARRVLRAVGAHRIDEGVHGLVDRLRAGAAAPSRAASSSPATMPPRPRRRRRHATQRVPFTPPVLAGQPAVGARLQLPLLPADQRDAAALGATALPALLLPARRLLEWNRIYGPRGFYQYQCVVPQAAQPEAASASCWRRSRHQAGLVPRGAEDVRRATRRPAC